MRNLLESPRMLNMPVARLPRLRAAFSGIAIPSSTEFAHQAGTFAVDEQLVTELAAQPLVQPGGEVVQVVSVVACHEPAVAPAREQADDQIDGPLVEAPPRPGRAAGRQPREEL